MDYFSDDDDELEEMAKQLENVSYGDIYEEELDDIVDVKTETKNNIKLQLDGMVTEYDIAEKNGMLCYKDTSTNEWNEFTKKQLIKTKKQLNRKINNLKIMYDYYYNQ